jgi:hypothetical protein
LQQEPLEFVPPELAPVPDVSGDQKDRCRNLVALQRRFGVMEIIGIAIVKRDDHRSPGEVAIRQRPDQLPELHGPTVLSQRLQLLGEMARRYAQ